MAGVKDEHIHCRRCRYNLTGCMSPRCPECCEPFVRHPLAVSSECIRCPACGFNLTGYTEPECPVCGRTFDRAEMLRRATWTAEKDVLGEPPLLKLTPASEPGGALWPDDLSDGPARLRPL